MQRCEQGLAGQGLGGGCQWALLGCRVPGLARPGRAGLEGGGARGGGGGDVPEPWEVGNVRNVSEKLKTFRSKERARIGFVGKERGSG